MKHPEQTNRSRHLLEGVDFIGGRGWNRTTNLSIKSRMLCQLSYASVETRGPNVERHAGDRRTHLPQAQAKYSIIRIALQENNAIKHPALSIAWIRPENTYRQHALRLKREGKSALNRPLVLGEIERAAIAGEEGAIALRQQITNIH